MRSPDFSTRAAARAGSRWEPLLLAAGVAIFAASAAQAGRSWSDARAAEASLAGLRREVDGERARLAELDARPRAGLSTSRLVLTAEAPPARVLAELAALMPPDVRLESIGFDYGARLEIEASTLSRRPAAYDLFLERLAASPLFSEIQPGPEAREGEMRGSLRLVYARLP